MSSDKFQLYKSLGSLIKDYRKYYNLSQETFAASIEISVRELRRWESNHHRARIDNLHDLTEFTGIPMQVCVALNADQPVWYLMSQRQFAYSSFEIKHSFLSEQSGDRMFTIAKPIATDKHISKILSFYDDIHNIDLPLSGNVIKKAGRILPEMNHIIFDSWGHYIGHNICLPINKEVYRQLKQEKSIEKYIIEERICDIIALGEGVFFFYHIYSINASLGRLIHINNARYLAEVEKQQRYLVAVCSAEPEEKKQLDGFGMRAIPIRIRNIEQKDTNNVLVIHELELDSILYNIELMEKHKWLIEKDNDNTEIINSDPFYVDDPVIVDKLLHTKHTDYLKKCCPNPQCSCFDKQAGNKTVSNGTYRTKEGTIVQRFLCKECGKSFSVRSGGIFPGLRSSDKRVLIALKLLAKGMPLRGVSKYLNAKLDTIRYWLKIAAEQNGKYDALLIKELNISQAELDNLWSFVKKNSLRKRAMLWKKKVTKKS